MRSSHRVRRLAIVCGIALGSIALVGTGPARVRAESSGPVVVHVEVSPGGKTWHVTGGAGASLNFSYFPTTVTVRPGVRVMWTNTSPLPEPHTVTFLLVNPQTGEIDGPPLEIVRPKPGHAGSQNPVDQDVVENPLYILPSTVTHASFLNSGTLFPAGTVPGMPSAWSVTFTATDAGKTFDYTCAYHPWMTGRVIVAVR